MKKQHILIVDDEPDIRELLEITLSRMGLDTTSAATLEAAIENLSNVPFDLCLTDMKLPDGNGLNLIEHIQTNHPDLPVAMITAFGSMDIAIGALKAGAFDFISKPIDLENLRRIIQSALQLDHDTDQAATQQKTDILGNSAAIKNLLEKIQKLARSQAPVFIHGESGSGKEMIARSIHQLSPRQGEFVAINCGAIPTELMESEFFGHVKGSFTGANTDKQGLFQAAHGGTLFLDEVADLPVDMQVKLLRAIQEKSIRPVGSEKEIAVDVRLLSASHKNLQTEINHNRFRQDLFFRINVIQLDAPPLRERQDDIPILSQHFLNRLNQRNDGNICIDNSAIAVLKNYHFPGNVRELENILERAYTLCENNTITLDDLLFSERTIDNHSDSISAESLEHTRSDSSWDENQQQPPRNTGELNEKTNSTESLQQEEARKSRKRLQPGEFSPTVTLPDFDNLDDYLISIERDIIEQALEASRWNKTAAAKLLGVSFRQLRYKLQKLELD